MYSFKVISYPPIEELRFFQKSFFLFFFLISGVLPYIENSEVLCNKVKMSEVCIFLQTLQI
jgi:hypothetical protein